MLQLTAIGRITKDPEIKKNSKGADFVVFDLAVNKDSTAHLRITAHRKTTRNITSATVISCFNGNSMKKDLFRH